MLGKKVDIFIYLFSSNTIQYNTLKFISKKHFTNFVRFIDSMQALLRAGIVNLFYEIGGR